MNLYPLPTCDGCYGWRKLNECPYDPDCKCECKYSNCAKCDEFCKSQGFTGAVKNNPCKGYSNDTRWDTPEQILCFCYLKLKPDPFYDRQEVSLHGGIAGSIAVSHSKSLSISCGEYNLFLVIIARTLQYIIGW